MTQPLPVPEPSALRALWGLAPGVVFLNHGSFGACPRQVLELQTCLRQEMEREPIQFLWRRFEERLEPSRIAVAEFVKARPRDVVFVPNATTGINAVARSFPWRAGDELLTTNLDYNACRNALVEAVRPWGARVVVANVPFPIRSPQEALDAILAAVGPRTRLAMIDHVTSNTALILPIDQIVRELTKRHVEVLIDGAHAPGMLDLDIPSLGAAYYTGNLHKWVCAPKGCAFLWVREDKQEGLQPAVVSHGNNTSRPGYSGFQDRFDWAGTLDPTGYLCAGAAIRFMGALFPGGWPELRRHNKDLVVEARRALCEQLAVGESCPETMLGSIATLRLPEALQGIARMEKIDPEQQRLYDEFRVEIPLLRFGIPERRYLRISAQAYNTMADYQYLAEALKAISRS